MYKRKQRPRWPPPPPLRSPVTNPATRSLPPSTPARQSAIRRCNFPHSSSRSRQSAIRRCSYPPLLLPRTSVGDPAALLCTPPSHTCPALLRTLCWTLRAQTPIPHPCPTPSTPPSHPTGRRSVQFGLVSVNWLASIWRPRRPFNPFPRPLRSVTMPPAAAVVPDVTADAFCALSPPDRLAAVTPRDSLPCTGPPGIRWPANCC